MGERVLLISQQVVSKSLPMPQFFNQIQKPIGIQNLQDQIISFKKEASDNELNDLNQADDLMMMRRKNRKRLISNPNQNVGHWSEDEHKTYVKFLLDYKNIMESQDMKKTSKIFKRMSEDIGSRSPSQCRSHHQKFNPFSHHIKKRQKGAGRKRKDGMGGNIYNKIIKVLNESSINFLKKYEGEMSLLDHQLLNPFLFQNQPFCLPPSYQFVPELNMNMGSSCLGNQEDIDKLGLVPPIIDQMMMLQFMQQQQQQIMPQQQILGLQQGLMGDSGDANKFYNFSFIQAPLNLSINYMPHLFNNQEFSALTGTNPFIYENLGINDEQMQQMQQAQYNENVKNHQQ